MRSISLLQPVSFLRAIQLRRRGNTARDNRNWEEAVRWYRGYLELRPRSFAIWVQLGHAHKETGNFDRAYGAYARALELDPADADLLLNFGRLLLMIGRREEALKYFIRSFELDKNSDAEFQIVAITGRAIAATSPDQFDEFQISTAEKILRSGYFDPNWYFAKYPDTRDMPPLDHFCQRGVYEWRSPGPNFDTEWYMLQNRDLIPSVAARALNPLLHFLEHGRVEGRSALPDPQAHTAIQDLLDGIFDIEPDIYAVETFANLQNLKSLKILDGSCNSPAFLCFKKLFASLDKPYDYIIAVPWLKFGGADLVSMHIARAIVELDRSHSILILVCDFANTEAVAWLPANVDMALLQPDGCTLSLPERVEVLSYMVQAIRPKSIVNVNSHTCWELFKTRGLALSRLTRTYGCGFCRDYSSDGRASGYTDTHLRDSLPWMSGVISDNASFFDELTRQFGIPDQLHDRFITLYNPAPEKGAYPVSRKSGIGSYQAPKKSVRPKILWASRLSGQKNVGIVKDIAKKCPEFDFDIWGKGEMEHEVLQWFGDRSNVFYKGPYASFDEIPDQDYDIFLYTSLWDGIPNVLLEAAAKSMRIIASNVGGIAELINDQTGWLIDDISDADAYVAAIRAAHQESDHGKARTQHLTALLERRHSWENFKVILVGSGIVECVR